MVPNTKFLLTVNIILLCLYIIKAQTPYNLATSSDSPTTVLISCQCYDAHNTLDEFSVRYTLERKEQCNSDNETLFDEQLTDWAEWDRTSAGVNIFEFRMELTGLFPYSSYTYDVMSRYSPSTTYTSNKASFTTQSAAPSMSPTNIRAIQFTETSASFSWNPVPCTQQNGPNFIYYYSVVTKHSNTNLIEGMEANPGVILANINLHCNENYEFHVASMNDVGTSSAGIVDISPEYAPYSVQNVQTMQTATTLYISWEASETGCDTSLYLVRIITLVNQDQCIDTSTIIRDPDMTTETSLSQMNLMPYTTYRVEITPWNSAGYGPMTNKDITTSDTAPTSMPSNLRIEDQGPCTLQFTWDPLPCLSRGGQLTYVYEIDNMVTEMTDYGTVDTNRATHSNLLCLGSYQMRVKARNSAGESEWSNYQAASTVLSNISITRFVGDSSTELFIKWNNANGDCSCSVIYIIEYTLTNPGHCGNQDGGMRMKADVTSSTSYTLTGLLPYSTYDVYVTPMVDGRNGDEASSSGTTTQSRPTSGPVVSVNERTKSSINFTWQEIPCDSRGGTITSYNAQLTYANHTTVFQMILGVTQLSVNITGLQPDQQYIFTISATNWVGQGPLTEHTAKTLSLGPNPPQSVSVQSMTVNSLTFSWEEATCNGLDGCTRITRYSYKLDREYVNSEQQGTSTDTMVTITDLLPCTDYEFFVAATSNSGQTGSYSNPLSAQTEKIEPSSVRNLTFRPSDRSAMPLVPSTVQWSSPTGQCPANEYLIKYQLITKDQCEILTDGNIVPYNNVTGTETTLNGLLPHSTYRVYVTAKNRAGSADSQSIDIQTEEAAPLGMPSNVRNKDVSPTSIIFTWDEVACGDRRGNIIQYHCQIISTSDRNNITEQVAATKIVLFTGLQPCTTYEFTVAAVTAAGTGPGSTKFAIKTGESEPSSVTKLVSIPLDRSMMPLVPSTVQWEPPSSGPCQADEYLIEYQLLMRDQCESVTDGQLEIYDNVTETHVTLIELLQPHSTYKVFVTARNDGGDAEPRSIDIQTEESKPTGQPLSVMAPGVGRRSLSFSWIHPECGGRNGDIVMYSYELTDHRTNNVIKNETPETTVSIDNLTPYVNYSFRIAANNSAGQGPFSDTIMKQTLEDVPTAPLGLGPSNTDTTSITIEWLEPDPPHGVIIRYHIEYWKTSESMSNTMSATSERTTFSLSGLKPNDGFSFRVQAETSEGKGDWSTTITAAAMEGLPGAPVGLRAEDVSGTSVTITWSAPTNPNGIIIEYMVKYKALERLFDPKLGSDDKYTLINPAIAADVTLVVVDKLEPSTKYEFRVSGRTSAGQGDEADIEEFTGTFEFDDSGVPRQPYVDASGQTVTVDLSTLHKYTSNVYISVEKSDESTRKRRAAEDTLVANLTRSDITDDNESFTIGDNKTYGGYTNDELIGGENYFVMIQYASCTPVVEECSASEWSNPTTFKAPVYGFNVKNGSPTSVVPIVMIVLVIFIFVILIVVIIIKRDKIRTVTARLKTPEAKVNPAYEPDINDDQDKSAHITAESPTTRAKNTNDYAVAPVASTTSTPVPSPSLRHKPPISSKPSTPKPKARRMKPIPVDKIKDHIEEQSKDGSKGFKLEFNSIPGEKQKHSWDDAELEENASTKNRFINILPYDHSRVKLQTGGDDPVANYINASIVKVYNERTFIASQGPLLDVAADTWQMMWEQRSQKIIMVTNLVEKGRIKCDKYWPEGGPCKYGKFMVTPLSEQKYVDYTIRSFKLAPDEGDKGGMEIRQFHFTDWPDFGVPKYPTPVLNFMKAVNAFSPEGSGPPIIHCSAGVGRTGTYLTIDSMLEMAKEKGEINVPNFVAQIREGRVNLVQTAQQYQFIYEALYESLHVGDTSILITHLREEVAQLSAKIKKGENKGKTGIEQQFQLLNELTVVPDGSKDGGVDPENADKNRYPDKVPDNSVRPGLMTPGSDENCTDYINAAYVDSRRYKDAFLVTQMPMPTTKGDIWRMVNDHNSHTIVMLNEMDSSDSTIAKYWPDETSSITVGPLNIEFQLTQKLDDTIIGRSFKITNNDEPQTAPRIILQLQYSDWPAGSDVPTSAKTFLSLVSLVQSHREQNREKGPITVHCLDGLGRTGMFCALLSMAECMKSEKMVDVFQEVKRLRSCRPGMVENVTQYKYLFDAATEYLDQFNSYENFSPTGIHLNGTGESSETESAGGDVNSAMV